MSSRLEYPPARRLDLVEEIHGRLVADPYRWLEDPDSTETQAWLSAEAKLWEGWAAEHLGGRPELRRRLAELIPGFTGAPHVVGERRFWMARRPTQDHAVLSVAGPSGVRTLVDPNELSPDGTVTLDGWAPSLEGDRLAYQLSSGGDEESRIWVIDVDSGEVLDGPVDRARYSPMAWLPGGKELIYVRRLAPDLVAVGESQYHRRVYHHTIGADPSTDPELFGDGIDMTAYFGVDASPDGRWVAVTTSLGTAPRNDLHLRAIGSAAESPWRPVVLGVDVQASPHLDQRGALWLLSDLDAPRRRLCRDDPARLAATGLEDGIAGGGWPEVIGEDPDGAVLESFVLAGEHLVVLWSRHAISEVTVHDRSDGRRLRRVELPGVGSADLTARPDEGPEVWLGYADYATPYRVYTLDPATGTIQAMPSTETETETETDSETDEVVETLNQAGKGPAPRITSGQIIATSADGTEVCLTVVTSGRADGPLVADRARPTVLYGYGGFNISLTPSYSSTIRAWVEAGGVWVVAHLRGGSEEGEAWHRDGMRQHKHHVFEDFEAAADLLVSAGWTTGEQLGISGGSNGGLLVGAALTRGPQRYRAVVCSAPLLDMVRYELFGLGATWNDEYGTAADPIEFAWLADMSPYHHVMEDTAYPAVLFTVFESDSRVDPLHGRKLAAALQWASSSGQPVLFRSEAEVGHGARSVSRTVDLAADQLSFFGEQLGLTTLT
jgi:prolyl oligopeptidase